MIKWPKKYVRYISPTGQIKRSAPSVIRHNMYRFWISYLNPNIEVVGFFTNDKEKIDHRCRVHHAIYSCRPNDLKNKNKINPWFPCCAKKEKQTHHEMKFIAWVEGSKPDIKILGRYKNAESGVEIQCRKCQHIWSPTPNQMRLYGCPSCAGNLRKPHDVYIKEMGTLHPTIKVIGQYRGNKQKIEHQCLICNQFFSSKPNSLLSKRSGCPCCGGTMKLTPRQYVDWLANKHPHIDALESYLTNDAKILHFCKLHNYTWKATPHDVRGGHLCSVCSGSKHTRETYIERLNRKRDDVILIGEYQKLSVETLHQCLRCQNTWLVKPGNLLGSGTGCPACCYKHYDILYYWQDDNDNWKFGITKSSKGEGRPREVGKVRNTGVRNLRMMKVDDPVLHEGVIRRMFHKRPYSSGDGYTEFRTLSDEETQHLFRYFDVLESNCLSSQRRIHSGES